VASDPPDRNRRHRRSPSTFRAGTNARVARAPTARTAAERGLVRCADPRVGPGGPRQAGDLDLPEPKVGKGRLTIRPWIAPSAVLANDPITYSAARGPEMSRARRLPAGARRGQCPPSCWDGLAPRRRPAAGLRRSVVRRWAYEDAWPRAQSDRPGKPPDMELLGWMIGTITSAGPTADLRRVSPVLSSHDDVDRALGRERDEGWSCRWPEVVNRSSVVVRVVRGPTLSLPDPSCGGWSRLPWLSAVVGRGGLHVEPETSLRDRPACEAYRLPAGRRSRLDHADLTDSPRTLHEPRRSLGWDVHHPIIPDLRSKRDRCRSGSVPITLTQDPPPPHCDPSSSGDEKADRRRPE
jgi:hypothetical protein